MGVACVAHDILGEVVLQARRVGRFAVVLLRVVVIHEAEREDGGNGRAARCDGLVVAQRTVFLVVGETHTQRERQLLAQVQRAVGEGRHRLGLLLEGGQVGAVVGRMPEEHAAEGALAAPDELVLEFDLLLRVEGADGPVEALGNGVCCARQTEFLREQRDFGQVLVREQRGDAGKVIVFEVAVLVVTPGADRGEVHTTQIPVDLRRDAAILGLQTRVDVQIDLVVLDVGRVDHLRAYGCRDGAVEGARARIVLEAQRRAAGLIKFGIVGDHADAEILVRHEQQLPAQAVAVEVVQFVAGDYVVEPAVPLGPGARQPEARRGTERHVHYARGARTVVLLVAQIHGAGRFGKIRLLREHAHDPARGVLAEKGALRPLQHLDALHVDQVGAGKQAGAAAVDAIDEGGNSGFKAHVEHGGAQTTQREGRALRGRIHCTDLEGGHGGAQIEDVGDDRGAQRIARERGDGDGNVHHVLGALLRRDDDLFERCLREGGRCQCGKCCRKSGANKAGVRIHVMVFPCGYRMDPLEG